MGQDLDKGKGSCGHWGKDGRHRVAELDDDEGVSDTEGVVLRFVLELVFVATTLALLMMPIVGAFLLVGIGAGGQ
ncbi:MAG: hypothetical protein HY667_04635 [Chloroflexi bacterium]|nr:hypothetical protein [Chloroflexota bacterium]